MAALMESAVQRAREGQFVQARLLCEQALRESPDNPDALHLYGVIALRDGEHAAAVESLNKAARARPDDRFILLNLAYGYAGLRRLPEALAAFEQAAKLEPNDPEPQVGIGNCLAMMGKPEDAEAVFRRVVARQPQFALGWFNLAHALEVQERYAEAYESYARAVQLTPRSAEAHCSLGVTLNKLGRLEEAERTLRAALVLDPGFIPALTGLAVTLNGLRRHGEAEGLCRQALARDPAQKGAWPALGNALVGQGRWGEAVQCYERAVEAYPGSSEALGDLGIVLASAGRRREAFEAFDRAYELGNVSALVRYCKAAVLFSIGRIAEGAAEFVGRHDRAIYPQRHPGRPLATELPPGLQGRSVCLIGEQGVGDEIFFLRFATPLKLRGCRIHYFGNPKLSSILARCAVLDGVTASTSAFVPADYNVLVGDLPHLLNGTEASTYRPKAAARAGVAGTIRAYSECYRVYWPELPPPLALTPLPERLLEVRERLSGLGPPPYLGLTWRAGTALAEQRGLVWLQFKEIGLEELARALRGVNGTLIALQRKPLAGEMARLESSLERPVHDLTALNDDLESMLALLALIDDYIGVSNTNMHLRAGAGRGARVLVPQPPEWRWMAAGDESPWFPGFRIYRQGMDGDWNEAVERLARDLRSN